MREPVRHKDVRRRLIDRANTFVKRGLERWRFQSEMGEIVFSSTLQAHYRLPTGATDLVAAMFRDDETVFYDTSKSSMKYKIGAPTVSMPVYLGQFPDNLVRRQGGMISIDDTRRRLVGSVNFWMQDDGKIGCGFAPVPDAEPYSSLFKDGFEKVKW